MNVTAIIIGLILIMSSIYVLSEKIEIISMMAIIPLGVGTIVFLSGISNILDPANKKAKVQEPPKETSEDSGISEKKNKDS